MKISRIFCIGVFANFLIAFSSLQGQTFEMLLDINQNPAMLSSNPDDFIEYNNSLFFVANTADYGREMWVYDGTNDPRVLLDINPGKNNSQADVKSIVYKNKLYFIATNGIHGYELWQYNGYSKPSMVVDINPNNDSFCSVENGSGITSMVIFKDKLYFTANKGDDVYYFWEYDGENLPKQVGQALPGFEKSLPNNLFVYNHKIYFGVDRGWGYSELFVFDGVSPAEPVLGLNSEVFIANPRRFTIYNNDLYFIVDTAYYVDANCTILDIVPSGVCRFNGTDEPEKVINMEMVDDIAVFNNKIYISGLYLYAYDTANKWSLIETPDQMFCQNIFSACNEKLFVTLEKIQQPQSLWYIDSLNTFNKVVDFCKYCYNDYSSQIIRFNGLYYFGADIEDQGVEFYKYNGIDEPVLVKDFMSGTDDSYPNGLFKSDNHVYFWAQENDDEVIRLYCLDTLHNITVIDSNKNNSTQYGLYKFTTYNEKFIYTVKNNIYSYKKGTNPELIIELPKINTSLNQVREFFILNNKLFFLWLDLDGLLYIGSYDETATLLKYADLGPFSSYGDLSFTVFREKLFYVKHNVGRFNHILTWNGFNEPVVVDSFRNNWKGFTVFNQNLYYSADSVVCELVGGNNFKRAYSFSNNTYIASNLAVLKNAMYFLTRASNSQGNTEIWRLHKNLGLEKVASYNNIIIGFNSKILSTFDNKLFFKAHTENQGEELCYYDVRGKLECIKINPFGDYPASNPSHFCEFNKKLYFSANNGIHGQELWVYQPQDTASPGNSISNNFVLFSDTLNITCNIGQEVQKTISFSNIGNQEINWKINMWETSICDPFLPIIGSNSWIYNVETDTDTNKLTMQLAQSSYTQSNSFYYYKYSNEAGNDSSYDFKTGIDVEGNIYDSFLKHSLYYDDTIKTMVSNPEIGVSWITNGLGPEFIVKGLETVSTTLGEFYDCWNISCNINLPQNHDFEFNYYWKKPYGLIKSTMLESTDFAEPLNYFESNKLRGYSFSEPPWLKLDKSEGQLLPFSTDSLSLTINTSDLKSGTYYAVANFTFNGLAAQNAYIPICFDLTTTDFYQQKSNKIKIYPNPANQTLNIHFPISTIQPRLLTIYNLTGQQILTQSIHSNNHSINVSTLAKGYYIISISDGYGHVVGSQPVVIY